MSSSNQSPSLSDLVEPVGADDDDSASDDSYADNSDATSEAASGALGGAGEDQFLTCPSESLALAGVGLKSLSDLRYMSVTISRQASILG